MVLRRSDVCQRTDGLGDMPYVARLTYWCPKLAKLIEVRS